MIITFVVPGKPQGKQRARKGEHDNWYTPTETVKYEHKIMQCFLLKYSMIDDRKHKWRVRVDICCSDKRRSDDDNIFHAIADALQAPKRKSKKLSGVLKGCVWHNDKQITEHTVKMHKCEKGDDRIIVKAETIGRLE